MRSFGGARLHDILSYIVPSSDMEILGLGWGKGLGVARCAVAVHG